jgi:hypothetical protein
MKDPATRAHPIGGNPLRYIWMGDFNCRHPLWDEEQNEHLFTRPNLAAMQPLLNLITRYGMKMALPKDIPTLEAMATKNYTQVDNVFCSADLLDSFISCDTDPMQRPQKTDHMPILSIIDIVPLTVDYEPCHNFCQTDWPEFLKALKINLDALPEPDKITTVDEFHHTLEEFDQAVQATIATHVPMSKPCPYSKRWWSKELAQAKAVTQKLSRKS